MKRILALLLCIFAAAALVSCGGGEEQGALQNDYSEQSVFSESGWRRTVIYYLSDEGYIVPVMKRIPWEEGIGKAAVSCLICTPENMAATAGLGFSPIIPNGSSVSLRIDESEHATLDITGFTQLDSAEAEVNMITAIVNTLVEFPSVETVSITVNGKGGKLENGTKLPENSLHIGLNPEKSEIETSELGMLYSTTLYFPNDSCSLNVPITVYNTYELTFSDAVNALIKGSGQKGLRCCFPEGARLLEAGITDGKATVNLSSAFLDTALSPGVDEAAYQTLFLTASRFGSINELAILVDGVPYVFTSGEPAPPLYVNEF